MGLSAGMKIVYAYVVYIAYSLASTVVNNEKVCADPG